jgi:hypothetical protein
MYEELFNTGEDLTSTSHPRIKAAVCPRIDPDELEKQLHTIGDLIRERDEAALLQMFYDMVPGYRCCKAAAESQREAQDCLHQNENAKKGSLAQDISNASPIVGKQPKMAVS